MTKSRKKAPPHKAWEGTGHCKSAKYRCRAAEEQDRGAGMGTALLLAVAMRQRRHSVGWLQWEGLPACRIWRAESAHVALGRRCYPPSASRKREDCCGLRRGVHWRSGHKREGVLALWTERKRECDRRGLYLSAEASHTCRVGPAQGPPSRGRPVVGCVEGSTRALGKKGGFASTL